MSIDTYQSALANAQLKFTQEEQALRKNRSMFKVAKKIAERWSDCHQYSGSMEKDYCRYSTVGWSWGSGVIGGIAVHLHLGKEDSLFKDVGPIIEELRERFEAGEESFSAEEYFTWKQYKFKNGIAELTVRVWPEKSTKCKLVPTGEFEEKYKIECEE